MTQLRSLFMGTVLVVLGTPGLWQARAPKSLVVTAQNVTAEAAGRADKTTAQPGDEIRYRLVFTNVTAGPVKNIQFVDPIPSGMVYVLGSATSNPRVRVEFSIDGGRTYSAQPMISAVENGKQVQQHAPARQYTNVRWTVVGSLAPAAQVSVEFRGRVTEAPVQ